MREGWRRQSLKINHRSWTHFLSRAVCSSFPSKQIPEQDKVYSPDVKGYDPAIATLAKWSLVTLVGLLWR